MARARHGIAVMDHTPASVAHLDDVHSPDQEIQSYEHKVDEHAEPCLEAVDNAVRVLHTGSVACVT
jgi:hypothetical protein